MGLISRQSVYIEALEQTFAFEAGEYIQTSDSHKYTQERITSQAPQLAQALLGGGLRGNLLTLTSPGALGALERLRREIPALVEGRAVIGMGSMTSRAEAESAVAAGAQFIVAPTIDLPGRIRVILLIRGQRLYVECPDTL